MFFKNIALFAAFLGTALAAPTQHSPHVLHERRDLEHPAFKAWTKRSFVPVGRELPVRIGLQQSNLDTAHETLMEISNPSSPRYGQHLSAEEVIELTAPRRSTVDAVIAWLEDAGIQGVSHSVNKQWIQFDTAVENLEDLLKTTYHEFVHDASGEVHVACDEYHVPSHIQEHIDYITPGVKLHKSERLRLSSSSSSNEILKRTDFYLPPIVDPSADTSDLTSGDRAITTCDYHITPGCVKRLYNITVGNTSVAGNELGIFEDLNDILDQKDLNQFFNLFYPTIPKGTTPILQPIDGAPGLVGQANGGPESTLDFEISYPIVYPQQIKLFQTDDKPTEANYTYDGFLNNFFDAIDGSYCTYSAFNETGNSPIDPPYPDPQKGGYKGALQCGVYTPTNVISISYGGDENSMPVNYQRRQCNEIMKLGMQGISVVVASGDDGVAGGDGTCIGPKGRIFVPDFPANCPYVTAVGATFLPYPRDAYIDAEVAVNRFPSGGGFSNIYPQPSYQTAAVQGYLAAYPPSFPAYQTLYNASSYNSSGFGADNGVYNSIGRAYPDVAAIGDGVVIINEGAVIIIGGTSASTPVFASVLTRINEERLLAGKSTVGFVNPTLYANPQVLHDITKGNNNACKGNGFKCGVGWDPVTGLGTPDYPMILDLFMSLP